MFCLVKCQDDDCFHTPIAYKITNKKIIGLLGEDIDNIEPNVIKSKKIELKKGLLFRKKSTLKEKTNASSKNSDEFFEVIISNLSSDLYERTNRPPKFYQIDLINLSAHSEGYNFNGFGYYIESKTKKCSDILQ